MRNARLGGCAAALMLAAALAVATGVSYAHEGHTTEDHTVESLPGPGWQPLVEGPGAARVVRTLPTASAFAGRADRRRSLTYFAQLTDFQLADEESPARVEFADRGAGSAFRPQEAFNPWAIDYSFRQLNQFTPASPHAQGGGARAPMDLALVTGDQSDNQQYNETLWVRQLIEGGSPLTPNSGIKSDYSECLPNDQAELLARETAGEIPDEPTYMGVQDYDDLGFKAPDYYDPDEPFGDQYGTFPTWPGLMDRAQSLTFTPVGLRRNGTPVPTYLVEREPRRPGPGQRGRDQGVRGHRDRLLQGSRRAPRPSRSGPSPTRTSCSRPGSASPFAPTSPAGASWTAWS